MNTDTSLRPDTSLSAGASFTIALAGNPNVGKSTIFNALTKLRQHTGNWAGKTVACASGFFSYRDARCLVVDLPGIYSLRTHSEEEEIAREYLCSGEADLLLVVCDATCLERGLHLLKQIAQLEELSLPSVILCVNLCDEAAKKGILLDFDLLSRHLKIPVIPCTARSKRGLEQLKKQIYTIYQKTLSGRDLPGAKNREGHSPAPDEPGGYRVLLPSGEESCCSLLCHGCAGCPFSQPGESGQESSQSAGLCTAGKPGQPGDRCAALIPDFSPKELAAQAVSYTNPAYRNREERLDRILTGRFTGSLIMILLLLGIFWLTITGANYPSSLLWSCFYRMENWLAAVFTAAGAPDWFISASVYGVFRVVAWIVSVMLPPMAIFFPLFTLLEDLGYLPRVAFNMDCAFKKCRACGKQCLTMCFVNAVRMTVLPYVIWPAVLIHHLPISKHGPPKMRKPLHRSLIAHLDRLLIVPGRCLQILL